jgi:leader peptidase (prepilin peptidase) / N-methyltransferase
LYFLLLLSFFLFGLCWGSFLNVVAYRIANEKSFFKTRSYCPFCEKTIPWYNNFPVVSWIILGRRCSECKNKISVIYPFIEILTAIIFVGIFFKCFAFQHSIEIWMILFVDFVFLNSLIVATATDLRDMVIPQIFTVWCIPVGITFSYLGCTQVSLQESLIGVFVGYGILWFVARLFKFITKKDGIGVGDMELLGMIGSFIGPLGVWFAIAIGSASGLIVGGFYLIFYNHGIDKRIPFGPFLAFGAFIYFFFQKIIIDYWIYSIPF